MQRFNSVDDMIAVVKAAKDKAAAEKQMPPVPMPYTPPFLLRMQLEFQRKELMDELTSKSHKKNMRLTYIGHEGFYSSTPLQNLKPILLREMQIRVRYTGRLLLCRTVGPASRLVCVTLGVEDPDGWAQVVSIYNFPGTHAAFGDELDTMFPENSIIAIREPMSKMALGASHSHIRIDSPSDIVLLKPGDPLLSGVRWATGVRQHPLLNHATVGWKEIGDKHFRSQQYFAAVVAYSNALHLNRENVTIRLNRSLARLRLKHYEASLRDLQTILSSSCLGDGEEVKALYRSAQAHYGLERFAEAKALYERCLSLNPSLEEAVAGVSKCTQRLCEQSLGDFDWASMFDAVSRSASLGACEVADYVGPIKVAPRSSRGGGRGVFATQDIDAGELLMVLKPIAAAVDQPTAASSFWSFNFLTNAMETQSRYDLIQKLVPMLVAEESLTRGFFQLYSRNNGVKSEQVTNDHFDVEDSYSPPFLVDFGHIESICSTNWFGFRTGTAALKRKFGPDDDDDGGDSPMTEKGTGLYLLASYFNHSCIPNAGHQFFSDLMVIRATQSIKQDEEITISYCSHASYASREKNLKPWFDQCDCQLCIDDRLAGSNRRSARESLSKAVRNAATPLPQARDALQKMVSTYSSQERVRPELSTAYHAFSHRLQQMAHEFVSKAAATEAIEKEIQSLEWLGVEVTEKGITEVSDHSHLPTLPISTRRIPNTFGEPDMQFLMIFGMFVLLGCPNRAMSWFRAAIWMSEKTIGGGIPMFKRTHSDIIRVLGPVLAEFLSKIESERA
ncbi:hypothetical protein PIIN_01926 [Serendipita indica DSM 11827]|uniref:SET domain-containing protein n=1 Tax=Serendipita indica (strain DSM 11827) TaxID=1109443 RepID=G4T9R6_SERID|nr:hypothetical protein PIIN_01926 [Serendipita indica DSM 11827]